MCALATLLKTPIWKKLRMADQIAMTPASGDEADEILVLEQKLEEMKRKGWTVKDEKPIPPKPKAKKETE